MCAHLYNVCVHIYIYTVPSTKIHTFSLHIVCRNSPAHLSRLCVHAHAYTNAGGDILVSVHAAEDRRTFGTTARNQNKQEKKH